MLGYSIRVLCSTSTYIRVTACTRSRTYRALYILVGQNWLASWNENGSSRIARALSIAICYMLAQPAVKSSLSIFVNIIYTVCVFLVSCFPLLKIERQATAKCSQYFFLYLLCLYGIQINIWFQKSQVFQEFLLWQLYIQCIRIYARKLDYYNHSITSFSLTNT